MRKILVAGLASACVAVVGLSCAPDAGAQDSSASPLPPALNAAVQSGNPQAVQRAVTMLAAGNPVKEAQLAQQVVAAAERLLSVNPQSAVEVATAAVQLVHDLPVQTAAPSQTETVLTTAARIFVAPQVTQSQPDAAAALAASVLAAAATTGNPSLIGNVATQAVQVAERLLPSSPATAVQLAANAVDAVRQQSVETGAPQQALQVATTAARIVVNPTAQAVLPTVVAQVAIGAVQVVTSPSVYQVAPNAAIQAMDAAYHAATSQTVAAAAPQATGSITQALNQASQNPQLAQSNPTNASQVAEILATTTSQTHLQTPPADANRGPSPVTPIIEANPFNSASPG